MAWDWSPVRGAGPLRRVDSPMSPLNLSWVPDGMDCGAACRVVIRVAAYEQVVDCESVSHDSREVRWVVDKDTMQWMDLYADLEDEVKHGSSQRLLVTYWDKVAGQYKEIASDMTLLAAFNTYWQIRRLTFSIDFIHLVL